jgi:hypothetical protein
MRPSLRRAGYSSIDVGAKRKVVTVVPEPIQAVLVTIVVDIANVMGARANGWWKDRARAAARLCREVGDLSSRGLAARDLPAEVAGVDRDRVYPHWVLVLEGAARRAAMPEVVLADHDLVLPATLAPDDALSEAWLRKRGVPGPDEPDVNFRDLGSLARLVLAPGSGDDTIAREAADLQGRRLVVTADRELRRRCEQAGAAVAGPRWLLGLL